MKTLGKLFSIVLGIGGVLFLANGLFVFFYSFKPLPPGTRSDFEPWFLACLGAGYCFLGGFLVLLALVLVQKNANNNQ